MVIPINNSIRIVFSDIDGTLLNDAHSLTPYTVQMIRKVAGEGIPFILISSRSPNGIFLIQRDIGISCPVVCYGGALIIERGEAIRSVGMEQKLAADIFHRVNGAEDSVCCTAYSFSSWYVPDAGNSWVRQESSITLEVPETSDLGHMPPGREIHKLLCMGEPVDISRLEERLSHEKAALNICKSKDTYLEIMDMEATKASAIRFLCAKCGLSPDDALSIGDNYNDIPMFRLTGTSAVMGNAPEDVKPEADHISLDNNHDGAGRILNKLIFAGCGEEI